MHLSTVLIFGVTLLHLSMVRAVSESCETDWKIDWYQQNPDMSNFRRFSTPGEILPGITINDTIQFVGLLWNSPSWHEVMGRFCIQFGPLLNALNPREPIQKKCHLVVRSLKRGEKFDIYGICASFWKTVLVEAIKEDFRQHRWRIPPHPIVNFIRSEFNRLEDVVKIDLIMKGLEKASHIAFGLLEWSGPSLFSGDMFGICSAARFLLSNDMDQIVNVVKTLLTDLVTGALEYLYIFNVCTIEDKRVMDVLYLLPISKKEDEYICDFLSEDPSPEEFCQKAEALVETFLSVPFDEDLCTDVIAFASWHDQYGANGYDLTGLNLTSWSNRSQFCREIASTLFAITQPPTYSFPDNYDINYWYTFAEAGQILPMFSLVDAVNVLGAFLRSDTLLNGVVVLCDVFESFVSHFDLSVESFCTALRRKDTATVERICRIMSLRNQDFHPSLRAPTPYYVLVTATDMLRKLSNLTAIHQEQVCNALDRFFHSENNLQSVIRLALNVLLSELLPIAHNICEDYVSVLDFIEKQTSLETGKFQRVVRQSRNAILTHLGFSDQEQFCRSAAAGIHPLSGRTKRPSIKNMEDRVVKFLTDTRRCMASIKSLGRLLTLTTMNSRLNFNEDFTRWTGFESITHFCEQIRVMFDPQRCKDSSKEKLSSHCIPKNPFEPEINVCMKSCP